MQKAFHNYCRSEKFFSATLLSYLFLSDNFKGLKDFFKYLNNNFMYPLCNNELKKIDIESIINFQDIHYTTEMNVIQDLIYGKQFINTNSFIRKKGKEAIPDIIAVVDNIILIIEVKYYTNYHEHGIYIQMENQKYIFDVLKDFYGKMDMEELHICVCPDKISIKNGYVVTWEEICNIFRDTPNCKFVLESLKTNLLNYSKLINQ